MAPCPIMGSTIEWTSPSAMAHLPPSNLNDGVAYRRHHAALQEILRLRQAEARTYRSDRRSSGWCFSSLPSSTLRKCLEVVVVTER